MYDVKPLFSDKYLAKKFAHLELFKIAELDNKRATITRWQKSLRNNAIAQSKEESLQGSFLQQFFVEVLGYSNQKDSAEWNLEIEQKTLDNKKIDGALGFFKMEKGAILADVRVVIELKNAQTDLDKPQQRKDDKQTPVQQAFDYANSLGGACRWIIVSNFKEIRLYFQTDRTRYQKFEILNLHKEEEFKQFYFLLNHARLISETGDSVTDKLYFEWQAEEIAICENFYQDYKQARLDFFHSLKAYNPEVAELVLLNKAQKMIDRIIFVHFCENYNLISSYFLCDMIKYIKRDVLVREKDKIYRRLRFLFEAINEGHPELEINKFNGGLFAEDEVLNSLVIDDAILEPVLKLVEYDLASDLGVNILGHIFEQSISDIEALKAEITGEVLDKTQGKRKKDGIYYTPDYITRYIVDEAIGGWLKDRRTELNEAGLPELTEADLASSRIIERGKNKGKFECNAAIQTHLDFYEAYKIVLEQIKVLDPACGSGAFLNQAFDFLYTEGKRVNEKIAQFRCGQFSALDLGKQILENNLFGVDLNEESIEITKLSLWIKTANRYRELTTLDFTIKCGNSLIDDENVAGKKAFVWEKEFKAVMDKGGFDIVIGNPPYATGAVLSQTAKEFYLSNFVTAQYQLELYILFIEKTISLLNKAGNISLITPNSWLKNLMMSECRKLMLHNLSFNKIIPNIPIVFDDASVDTLIFIASKAKSENNVISICSYDKKSIETRHTIQQNRLLENHKYVFDVEVNDSLHETFNKLNHDCRLVSDLFDIVGGVRGYDKYTGQAESVIKNKEYHANYKKDESFVPELRGKHISRYFHQWDGEHYISYGNWLAAIREERFFTGERIVFREVLGKNNFVCTLITEDIKIDRTLYIALPKENNQLHIKYILAILSSKFLSFYFRYTNNEFDAIFPKIRIAEFSRLPIKVVNEVIQKPFIEKANIMLNQNKALQSRITAFLNFLQAELNLQKITGKLQSYYQLNWDEFKAELKKGKVDLAKLTLDEREQWLIKFEAEKQTAVAIKTCIEQTDKEIDAMVYELYGLNAADIAIIEK